MGKSDFTCYLCRARQCNERELGRHIVEEHGDAWIEGWIESTQPKIEGARWQCRLCIAQCRSRSGFVDHLKRKHFGDWVYAWVDPD